MTAAKFEVKSNSSSPRGLAQLCNARLAVCLLSQDLGIRRSSRDAMAPFATNLRTRCPRLIEAGGAFG
jgi:hypothetical protein